MDTSIGVANLPRLGDVGYRVLWACRVSRLLPAGRGQQHYGSDSGECEHERYEDKAENLSVSNKRHHSSDAQRGTYKVHAVSRAQATYGDFRVMSGS